MTKLPKKYRKQLEAFAERYYELARPRKKFVSVKQIVPVTIAWEEDNKIRVYDNDGNDGFYLNLYESPEILKVNKAIARFIEDTREFGMKHFNDGDWVWHNILWDFRPEKGRRFDFKKVKWV